MNTLYIRLLPTIIVLLIGFTASGQNPFGAPLYWSVYEYHILKEQAGQSSNYIPESEWLANIDWVDQNLKDLGYDMICIDGWGDVSQLSENGYRLSHSSNWEHDYAWWSSHLQARGMRLGMYGNPLWVNVSASDQTTKIIGTDFLVSSLIDPNEDALWFDWVQVDRPGAEEYVKGYVKFYADMGVKYFRIDFLSWFESGRDRYLGSTGPERPREYYETALRWMKEEADKHGMFLSLVMPNLYSEAEAEVMYGHMFRINEDTGEGSWWKWSEKDRGIKREGWSVYANPFDGLTYWSYLSGRDSIVLDPDFIRLNTFANNEEKKSVISLCLLSGGALTVSDRYNSIGSDLWLYQNNELLELNWDGFAADPLSNDPTKPESQIWKGQMSTGEWVIGLFNRESDTLTRNIDFALLGIEGSAQVRDLWSHKNIGTSTSFSARIPPHGCRIIKVVPEEGILEGPGAMFVESLVTNTTEGEEMHGAATISVQDNKGNPVEGASVTVSFTASFDEMASGVTDINGMVTIYTTAAASGSLRINACVTHVSHPTYIYAADLNHTACVGDSYYVGGTFNDWSLKAMNYKEGQWRLDSVSFSMGEHELKFANTNDWTRDDWGNASGLSGTAQLTTGGDPNISFNIDAAGLYSISFNDETLKYVIEYIGVERLNNHMFVGGTFNDWQLTEMSFVDGQWKVDLEIEKGNHELKFANTSDWSGDDWGNASGLSGTAQLSTGGDPNLSFEAPQTAAYTISFDDLTLHYSISSETLVTTLKDKFQPLLYPNPAHDQITLKGLNAYGMVTIFNALGEVIHREKIVDTQLQVDVSKLSNGIFYIKSSSQLPYYKLIINK